jgi:hypothetical protein
MQVTPTTRPGLQITSPTGYMEVTQNPQEPVDPYDC